MLFVTIAAALTAVAVLTVTIWHLVDERPPWKSRFPPLPTLDPGATRLLIVVWVAGVVVNGAVLLWAIAILSA